MKIAPALLVICTTLGFSQGRQPDEAPSGSEAVKKLASDLRPTFGEIRLHREEQFEDRFLPNFPSADMIRSSPRIYRVEQAPTVGELFTGGIPTMYLAVSQTSQHIFELAGFSSPESNFAKLIAETPGQKVRSISDAESRGLLCAEIVYGLSPSWWIDDDSNVKLQAAQHFFAEGHTDGLLLAESWWKTAKGDRTRLKITTEPKGDGYQVNLPIFWAPVEIHSDPEVKLYQIEVTRAGTCANPVPPTVILS